MKSTRCVFKLLALAFAVAAAACCVAAYWEKIAQLGAGLSEKLPRCHCCPSEYDDYADWDA